MIPIETVINAGQGVAAGVKAKASTVANNRSGRKVSYFARSQFAPRIA